MEQSNDLIGFKEALEGREIKEVSIGYDGKLVIAFGDGGMALLEQNGFREWSIKHK